MFTVFERTDPETSLKREILFDEATGRLGFAHDDNGPLVHAYDPDSPAETDSLAKTFSLTHSGERLLSEVEVSALAAKLRNYRPEQGRIELRLADPPGQTC